MASIAHTIFSPELAARFDQLVTRYPVKRSALVPMLLYAQDEIGFVSEAAIQEIARRLDLFDLDVRNVLSYYSMLRTTPAGKYNVQVCTNISCMLRGGYEILDHCKAKLGIGHKQVTKDGQFSLEEVECIGRLLLGTRHPGQLRLPRRPHPREGRCAPRRLRGWPRKGREIVPRNVSHPDEVIVLKRRFGQGAANIDKYLELDGYKGRPEGHRDGSRGRHQRDEGKRPARTWRRRLPYRPQVVVRAQGRARNRSTSLSTATSPSPAPARTTFLFLEDPHAMIGRHHDRRPRYRREAGLHLPARRVPLSAQNHGKGGRGRLCEGLPGQEHLRQRRGGLRHRHPDRRGRVRGSAKSPR